MYKELLCGLLLAFTPLSVGAQIEIGEEAIDLSSAQVVQNFGYPNEDGYYAIATGRNLASVAYACQEAAAPAGIVYQDYVEITPISGGVSTGVQFYCVGALPVSSIEKGKASQEVAS